MCLLRTVTDPKIEMKIFNLVLIQELTLSRRYADWALSLKPHLPHLYSF